MSNAGVDCSIILLGLPHKPSSRTYLGDDNRLVYGRSAESDGLARGMKWRFNVGR